MHTYKNNKITNSVKSVRLFIKEDRIYKKKNKKRRRLVFLQMLKCSSRINVERYAAHKAS